MEWFVSDKHNMKCKIALVCLTLSVLAAGAFAAAKTKYYAACDGHGVGSWFGSYRDTHAEAKADAAAHDNEKHGGRKTASVMSITN